ncbi:MAG: hypothetical protein WBE12_15430, partial [Candidatus Acidiferrum sp.]
TKDGAATWTNVSKNISGMPPWGTITSIAPSNCEAGPAYVAVDFHLLDNRDPFIYKTTDFGKTWKQISSNLPKHPLAYVRTIAEDPNCAGLLFAGTGNGLYYSLNDGELWTPLQTGLPHAPVTWAVVQKEFHDLVISTYGRGLYILDDITPLEQLAKNHSDAPTVFFDPRPARRFVHGGEAILNFDLKSAPKESVQLEILSPDGKTIRKLEAKGRVGINRVKWDMHYDSPRLIALRTAPDDDQHIWTEPRFRDADSRPITHWGIKPAEVGPMVAPGKYSVRLTVAGQSFTQPLTVLPDPRVSTPESGIEASVKTQLRIRDDITQVSDTVNQIEWLRKQIEVIQSMLRPPKKKEEEKPPFAEPDDYDEPEPAPAQEEAQTKRNAELLKTVEAMDKKLQTIEFKLVTPEQVNSDDKYFVEADKVYLNLIWLNAEVGTGGGDVAGGSDFPPTDTEMDLLKSIETELTGAVADYKKLMEQDLPAFNHALSESNVAAIVAATSGAASTEGGN